jgi:hypothetical protein
MIRRPLPKRKGQAQGHRVAPLGGMALAHGLEQRHPGSHGDV